jgi:cell division protein FtsN
MEREIRAELERERAAAASAPAQPAATDNGRYMMQCAALRSQDSAESLKARIAFGAGLSSSLQVINGANGTVYKVMVGPFNGKAAVDAANRKLQSSGISGCIPKKG